MSIGSLYLGQYDVEEGSPSTMTGTVTLTFNRPLADMTCPVPVTVSKSAGGGEELVEGQPVGLTNEVISSVSIDDDGNLVIVLEDGDAFGASDSISVSYAPVEGSNLADADGNQVGAFSNFQIANSVPPS